MKKNLLGPIKEYFTFQEVADKLSCPISDVLQLALNGKIKLSVYFVAPVLGRVGKVQTNSTNTGSHIFLGKPYFMEDPLCAATDNKCLTFTNSIETLSGLYDLPMLGGEKQAVKNELLKEAKGPTAGILNGSGFLVGLNNSIFQICRPAVESDFERYDKNCDVESEWPADQKSEVYCPVTTLPEQGVFVIRKKYFSEFTEAIAEENSSESSPSSDLKIYNNLLKICAAMAIDKYGYSPDQLKSHAPANISKITERLGIAVSAQTIRKRLEEGAELIDQDALQDFLKENDEFEKNS